MTFKELYLKGEIEFDEIHTLTSTWNFSDDPRPLREYLGLNATEEDVWISQSDEALEALLDQARKDQRHE